jgi:hypothetical protein
MLLLPEVLSPMVLIRYWKPTGVASGSPSVPWAKGRRWSGLTGGKILPAHDYRDNGMYWHGILLGLVLFRLVVPPLQAGIVGPYPIRGAWFPSHLPLEGISRIQIFGSYLATRGTRGT